MNPATSILYALSFTSLFIGSMLIGTGSELPIPIPDSSDDSLEPFFSGNSGNFSIDSSDSDFLSVSVFIIGSYQDSDSNGLWDLCESSNILVWNEADGKPDSYGHENNTFYPLCEPGFEMNGSFNTLPMINIGAICQDPSKPDLETCRDGIYTFESTVFMRLVLNSNQETSLFATLIDAVISGLRTGYSILCGAIFFFALGLTVSFFSNENVEPREKKSKQPLAVWKAYSLSQAERGKDGLPKAFSRHVKSEKVFRKQRKGNTRGGVHKSGGLFLDGWTEEDSDEEYQRKVANRRGRRG